MEGQDDGELLEEAVNAGFDVLVTGDSHLPYQQDLSRFDIAVIQLRPSRMVMRELEGLVPGLLAAIETTRRRQLIVIGGPGDRRELGAR